MKENFEKCFAFTMKQEGGFVNNPKDPGGMTNHGVTKYVWEAWIGHEVTEQAMRALTLVDVEPLYKKYWNACRCSDLPEGIDMVVFDTAVNSGTTKASKLLQQVLSTTADGIIGPGTLAAASKADAKTVVVRYCDSRLAWLKGLAAFKTFGKGWTARITALKDAACSAI